MLTDFCDDDTGRFLLTWPFQGMSQHCCVIIRAENRPTAHSFADPAGNSGQNFCCFFFVFFSNFVFHFFLSSVLSELSPVRLTWCKWEFLKSKQLAEYNGHMCALDLCCRIYSRRNVCEFQHNEIRKSICCRQIAAWLFYSKMASRREVTRLTKCFGFIERQAIHLC